MPMEEAEMLYNLFSVLRHFPLFVNAMLCCYLLCPRYFCIFVFKLLWCALIESRFFWKFCIHNILPRRLEPHLWDYTGYVVVFRHLDVIWLIFGKGIWKLKVCIWTWKQRWRFVRKFFKRTWELLKTCVSNFKFCISSLKLK